MAEEAVGDEPVVRADDVVITAKLTGRTLRPPDHASEARALGELARQLADDPQALLQAVTETARTLCRADSAGVSVLERGAEGDVFRWHAISGAFATHLNATLPREASPCGEVVSRNAAMLLDRPERFYRALRGVEPRIHEALLVPWDIDGRTAGTLWVIGHVPDRHFDAEDARLLGNLARFAAAARQASLAGESTKTRDAQDRTSEALHRVVVESARDYAIITTDVAGNIASWSPGAEAVFGWPASEIVGQPIAVTFTPEDREADQPRRELEVAEREGVAPDVRWHLRKDGQRVFIEGTTRAMRSDEGMLLGFLKIGQDVTQRRQTEQALRESEARYRALVENVRDYAIVLLDPEGIITDWTPGAEHVTGFTASEAVGRHISLLYTPEDVAAGEPQRELAEASVQNRVEREGWRLRKNGARFWANEIATSVRSLDGTLTGFTRISRDLSERRRMEIAAERARTAAERDVLRRRLALAEEEERRRLSRELHDDAGQYLTALGLGLQALSDVAHPGSDIDRRAAQLRRIADTLGRELHTVAVRLRPKALDDFGLEAAIVSYADEWSKHFDIAVDVHADTRAPRLPTAVESAVYRIVQEALTNVARHSGARHAGVVIERHDRYVAAIIEDDGRGFDPDLLTPPGAESGLGLLGIRERAGLLGGVVEIESVIGKGTTLFVRFPLDGAGTTDDASMDSPGRKGVAARRTARTGMVEA